MDKLNGKRNSPDTADSASTSERRRMGRVVHDDRGAASVEWRDAPDDYERPVLEIEQTGSHKRASKLLKSADPLSMRNDDTFNPYDRVPDATSTTIVGPPGAPGKSGKRDLKKLSAWLKMMRELEERKKKDGSED
ncbi:MAG: hypothetical protein ABI885_00845 [Gammaproteobacteria bacterium]